MLTGWTMDLRYAPGKELFLRNNMGAPVRVTSITIYDCENIQGGCRQFDPDIVLQPGEVRLVATIRPAFVNRASGTAGGGAGRK